MNILEEAQARTDGGPNHEYGEVLEAAERFATLARAATGLPVDPDHMPVLMLCLKLSRIAMSEEFPHDSWVDVAGWAQVAGLLEGQRDARAHVYGIEYEIADGLKLTRSSIEALHFHYTKNGIPESQTAATQLAATLAKWLEDHPEGKDEMAVRVAREIIRG